MGRRGSQGPPAQFPSSLRVTTALGVSLSGWLVQQEDGSCFPSDLPAAQVLWDPPERTLPVSQWIPTKPSGHWQMKALGRSLQEPPFLQGCARHSSVSVQTGGGTDSYGDLLHVPQDSICSLMISKALRPQCLGTILWSSAFLLSHPLVPHWLGCCPSPAPNIPIAASVHAPCSLPSQLETAPKLCPSRSRGLCFGASSPIQHKGCRSHPAIYWSGLCSLL